MYSSILQYSFVNLPYRGCCKWFLLELLEEPLLVVVSKRLDHHIFYLLVWDYISLVSSSLECLPNLLWDKLILLNTQCLS